MTSFTLDKLPQRLLRISQKFRGERKQAVLQALPQGNESARITDKPHGAVGVGELAPEETGLPTRNRLNCGFIR
jgi:hypothetical protein